MKKLPIFRMRIKESDTDKLQVEAIALVDEPAILVQWQAFANHVKFSVDKERQLLMAPVMLADFPIFRRDKERGEHYVLFDKEEIYKIAQKFFRKGFASNFNLMHDEGRKIDGVYILETFLIDESRGIRPPKDFADVSQGSWFITVKVDNTEVWENFVKTGEMKGFSVEGMFDYEYAEDVSQTEVDEIVSIVENIGK